MNSTIKKMVKLFKTVQKNGTVNLADNKNKNVSIQLYLALERGIFIEFYRVHQPKNWNKEHRPPTIKQHRQQTNFINLKN
jgi:hypothetical protein